VAEHFSGLGAVTLLEGGAAPADAAPPPKGVKPAKAGTKKPGAAK